MGFRGRVVGWFGLRRRSLSSILVVSMVAASLAVVGAGAEQAGASIEAGAVYVSTPASGKVGGVRFRDEDILRYDADTSIWSMLFDGSDVGLRNADVNGFHIMDDGDPATLDPILITLHRDRRVSGLSQRVRRADVIRFDPTSLGTDTSGSWSWYFDGSDVGLTRSGEGIDAVALDPAGRLVLSTEGRSSVPGSSGRLVTQDEDLIVFDHSSLGSHTAGTFSLHFDGSDVGLTRPML